MNWKYLTYNERVLVVVANDKNCSTKKAFFRSLSLKIQTTNNPISTYLKAQRSSVIWRKDTDNKEEFRVMSTIAMVEACTTRLGYDSRAS